MESASKSKQGYKMSHDVNQRLFERAAELLDEIQSHPSGFDRLIQSALDSNDLESLRYWVNRVEGELSITHFANYEITVW